LGGSFLVGSLCGVVWSRWGPFQGPVAAIWWL
jgi:hypothetical protein